MRRRELIKVGSTLLGGLSMGAIAGYNMKPLNNTTTTEIIQPISSEIIPKQTAQYEYSSPMPFDKKLIDELYDLNQTLTKGKITTLYSSLPSPLAASIHPTLNAPSRENNKSIRTVDDYIEYVKYAISKGFKCIYTLNTTLPIQLEETEKLIGIYVPLFKKFKEAGINDVKISNPAILIIFEGNLPEFNLHLATTAEYHSAQAYRYSIRNVKSIKSINIATDENKNFELLKSLKELCPNAKLELLVNESACLKYCISRHYHPCTKNMGFACMHFMQHDPFLHIARNNLVHPWELEYYSAIGINNFKFTCGKFGRNNIKDIDYIKYYVTCVENGIDKYSANDFVFKLYDGFSTHTSIKFKKHYKISQLIQNLPNINYFIKNGARCASECGVGCRYCYDCAAKIEEMQA